MTDKTCDWCEQPAIAGINREPSDPDSNVLDLCAEHCLSLGLDCVEYALQVDTFCSKEAVAIEIGIGPEHGTE